MKSILPRIKQSALIIRHRADRTIGLGSQDHFGPNR